jgi:hypothetical protein
MKNLELITRPSAISMFINYEKELSASGVAFSNLTYIVDESKSKTKQGKKLLQKKVDTNATIGSDYGKKVGRILDKEGKEIEFTPQARNGMRRIGNSPVCVDTATESKFYLDFIVERHTNPQVQLILNGKAVERKEVWNEEYITPAGLNPKPQVAGRGLINEEHNFHFRSLNFNNLISFNMNGKCYLITD